MHHTNSTEYLKNPDLGDLYQEVILEHSKRPRFKQKPLDCQFCQEGKNPLCGDTLKVYCSLSHAPDDAKVTLSLHYDGTGCSISQASASMMCEQIQNKSLEETRSLISQAEDIYTGKINIVDDDISNDIEALAGVAKFPVRIKCAALAWKTLEVLLNENFDSSGNPQKGCDKIHSCQENNTRKIKIVQV